MINKIKEKIISGEKYRVGSAVATEIISNKNIHVLMNCLCKRCKRKAKRMVLKKMVGYNNYTRWCDDCQVHVAEFEGELDKVKINDIVKRESGDMK